MELLTPAGLVALALALPLTLLWLRRRRRVTRVVPALQLWRAVRRSLPPQTGLRRLVREPSWWLHLAALALVALALAGPFSRGPAASAARLVLVVDTTASMAARDGARARIDEAREVALRLLDALPRGAEAAVVEGGCTPSLAAPPGGDLAVAREAVRGLRVRGCGGDLRRALTLGADRLRGARAPRLVVITDGASAADALPPLPVRPELRRVGRPVANVGITAAELRVEGGAAALFVALTAAHLDAPRDLTVRVDLLRGAEEVSVARRRARVAAGRTALTLPIALRTDETADLLRVRLDGVDDALALDDVAWAPVPRGGRLAVRLVGDAPSPWLARALRADTDVDLETMSPGVWRARRAPFDGLTVLHRGLPPEAPAGVILGFHDDAEGPRALGFSLAPRVSLPAWTDVSETDPRVRFVGVADVHLASARPIVLGPTERALVRSNAGALVAARGDVTLAGFDPDRGDWPLRPGFVLFVRGAVEHARSRRDALRLDARRTGARVLIPAEVPSVRLTDEDGATRVVPVHDGVAAWTQTDRAGVWRVDRGRGAERVALSLLDPVESALGVSDLVGAQSLPSGSGEAPTARRPLAWLAALLALAAVLYESLRFAREETRR